MPDYVINRLPHAAPPRDWNDAVWETANLLRIDHFHERSSTHRPLTTARLLYDDQNLYLHFRVRDQYVRCTHIGHQAEVFRDSCAEFFVRPKPGKGYFNFETNCGGSMLLYFIEDHRRGFGGGFAKYEQVEPALVNNLQIVHSMPEKVDPEIQEPVEWHLQLSIPFALFEHFVGPLEPSAQRRWMGNFYKCADDTSHPHWGTWSPIEKELNFHLPQYFGSLRFAE